MTQKNQAALEILEEKISEIEALLERENLKPNQRERLLALRARIAGNIIKLTEEHPDPELKEMAVKIIKDRLEEVEVKANKKMLEIEQKLDKFEDTIEDIENEIRLNNN